LRGAGGVPEETLDHLWLHELLASRRRTDSIEQDIEVGIFQQIPTRSVHLGELSSLDWGQAHYPAFQA
jgi:hypothetical protein